MPSPCALHSTWGTKHSRCSCGAGVPGTWMGTTSSLQMLGFLLNVDRWTCSEILGAILGCFQIYLCAQFWGECGACRSEIGQ